MSLTVHRNKSVADNASPVEEVAPEAAPEPKAEKPEAKQSGGRKTRRRRRKRRKGGNACGKSGTCGGGRKTKKGGDHCYEGGRKTKKGGDHCHEGGRRKKRKTKKKRKGKKRKLNPFFKLMLAAKKAGKASFKYGTKLYKGKKHPRLGMIYKKA